MFVCLLAFSWGSFLQNQYRNSIIVCSHAGLSDVLSGIFVPCVCVHECVRVCAVSDVSEGGGLMCTIFGTQFCLAQGYCPLLSSDRDLFELTGKIPFLKVSI